MTADVDVSNRAEVFDSDASNGEVAREHSGSDVDLAKTTGDCKPLSHCGEEDDVNGVHQIAKDDVDGSYVFVTGSNAKDDDLPETDPNGNSHEIQVGVAQLKLDNGETLQESRQNNVGSDSVEEPLEIGQGKIESGTVVIDQTQQPAPNVEDSSPENLDGALGSPATKTETVELNLESPQIEDGKVEIEGADETHNSGITSDKSDFAADAEGSQESEIAVDNCVESVLDQGQEQKESSIEIPREGSAGDGLELESTTAPSPEPESNLDAIIENGDSLPAAGREQDGASECLDVHNPVEQNGSSENIESLPSSVTCENAADSGESFTKAIDSDELVGDNEVVIEGPIEDAGVELEQSLKIPACSESNIPSETEVANGPVPEENGEDLSTCLAQESISETLVIADSVDTCQTTPEQNCHVPLENGESLPIAPGTSVIEKPDVGTGEYLPSENLPTLVVEDVRPETYIEKSHQESSMVEKSDVRIGESLPSENLPTSDVEDIRPETDIEKSDQESSMIEKSDFGNETLPSENLPTSDVVEIRTETDIEKSDQESSNIERFDDGNGESLPAENLPTCDVEDIRPVTDIEKSDQESIANAGSCPTETETESCPIIKDPMVTSHDNDVRSVLETSPASTEGEEEVSSDAMKAESGISNSVLECAASVDHDRSEQASPGAADVKPDSEVENVSAVSSRDIPGDDSSLTESKLLSSSAEDSGSVLDGNLDDVHAASDMKSSCQEAEGIDGDHKDEASTSSPEEALEGKSAEVEVVKKPFYFLIKIPRYDDENIREQIKVAQLQVDEKTKSRDAVRVKFQMLKVTYKEYEEKVHAALTEERAARDTFKSKRQELDSVQFVINKVKDAKSLEDIDGRIRSLEHMIEHETLPLREEKQLIREIQQLRQHREQLSSSIGKQDEVQQALDQKDQIEERSKALRKELDLLRENLSKAELVTQAARKSLNVEKEKMNEISSQFRAADGIRQEAYAHLQSLKKQQYEKNKYFYKYKDDTKAVNDLASRGDKEKLQDFCVDQVERIMELWNRNDDFRREYIKSNTRSTLRRLRTLDGRSLGPDEEPPVIPDVVNKRVAKVEPSTVTSNARQEKKDLIVKTEMHDDKTAVKGVETKIQLAKPRKTAKPASSGNDLATISVEHENKEEERQESPKRTKEEEELAKKAEELRKEEEAAKLKEQRKLEEKIKAKEAMERKKRMTEKAQARAAIRALKEAEEKEKERERRLRKKERKKTNRSAEATNEVGEGESAPIPILESPIPSDSCSETKENPQTITKRSQKALQFTKQNKAKSIPPPLRNRGKRRMQPWMWVVITVLVVLALFLAGNSSLSFKSGLQWLGF
ncbi:hypothetical protein UlMin_033853 [Ulmus minor]